MGFGEEIYVHLYYIAHTQSIRWKDANVLQTNLQGFLAKVRYLLCKNGSELLSHYQKQHSHFPTSPGQFQEHRVSDRRRRKRRERHTHFPRSRRSNGGSSLRKIWLLRQHSEEILLLFGSFTATGEKLSWVRSQTKHTARLRIFKTECSLMAEVFHSSRKILMVFINVLERKMS